MFDLRALIVDDEEELRRSVGEFLKQCLPDLRVHIEEAGTGVEALEKVRSASWDLVLMDVRMPEMTGLEALRAIKAHDPGTFVVLMTAHGNLQDAIEAIKEGAYDYLEKPVQPERLATLVKKALEAREMVSSLAISNPIFDDDVETEFVGSSVKMRKVFDLIYRLGRVDTTVLIRGENGTGKELVARAIHYNSSRKDGAFVAINCGAIPDALMESELFGHEKGAFTGATERRIGKFQAATSGTLFLDEIAELKPEMQVKLLRVLQEKKFMPVGSNREVKTGARVIAATNRNLEKMIEEGDFREDLFYRLNVMPIFLPPLRERAEDIEDLIQHFVRKFAKVHGRSIHAVAEDALGILKAYQWPGNIRELENVIEHAFIVENSERISVGSLPDSLPEKVRELRGASSRSPAWGAPSSSAFGPISDALVRPLDFEKFKEQAEKDFIVSALKANGGRINQTVARANIPKNTLLRKIRKYGIDVRAISGAAAEKDAEV